MKYTLTVEFHSEDEPQPTGVIEVAEQLADAIHIALGMRLLYVDQIMLFPDPKRWATEPYGGPAA